jgi:sterol desaturase/sphingolipid hydroxylase (fatty acid hydroxylase superfamily)
MTLLPTSVLGTLSWAWLVPSLVAGAALWTFGEYALHRFAMHELKGKGLLSREHLMHHVRANWGFDPLILLAWLGVILVGVLLWGQLGLLLLGPAVGLGLALGWCIAYGVYEYLHAQAHLRAPRTPYQRWLRKHHFHHHFGHPMLNHGVTVAWWDRVFGTLDTPDTVLVPRRLAPAWMVDEDGELLPEHAADYELVGRATTDERLAQLDHARAFASLAPVS